MMLTKTLGFKSLRKIIKQNMADDFFRSHIFKNVLERTANAVSQRLGISKIQLQLDFNSKEADVAYTDNQIIYINMYNDLVKKAKDKKMPIEGIYLLYLGLLGHECGHLLFSDFDALREISEKLIEGVNYITPPKFAEKQEKAFKELENIVFSTEENRYIYSDIFRTASNILEDKYVNERMKAFFPGTFKTGINETYSIMFPEEEAFSEGLNLYRFMNYTHQYLEKGYCENAKKDFKEFSDEDFIKFLDSIENIHEPKERFQATYTLLAYAAEYLIEAFKNKELNNKNNKNTAPSHSKSKGKGALNPNKSKSSQSDSNGEKGEDNKENKTAENGEKSEDSKSNGKADKACDGDSIDRSKDPTANDICKDKLKGEEIKPTALSDVLTRYTETMIKNNPDKAKSIMASGNIPEYTPSGVENHGIDFHIPKAGSAERSAYNLIFSELKVYSERLKRGLQDIVDDKKDGVSMRNLMSGNRVNPASSASSHGKIFKKNKMPDEEPELAVSILIDGSGSMSGTRQLMAQKAAILIAEFCFALNIPVAIATHNAGWGNNISIYPALDFDDSVSNKYRLANSYAGGCNRDGLALRWSINGLSKRPEDRKIMIIISDGYPSRYNSYNEASIDIKESCKRCKRENILLVAAAIGDDKKNIQKLYGDAFLDISDLSMLPKKLINQIKRYI